MTFLQRASSYWAIVLALAIVNVVSTARLYAQEQTLYGFGSAPDGNYPASNLAIDHAGNLYGTTLQGGTSGVGIVFELAHIDGQWIEKVLYNFCQQTNCTDGSFTGTTDGFNPHAGLVRDKLGNLFGVTFQGGTGGFGTAFEITP